jgi:hypothetical protein
MSDAKQSGGKPGRKPKATSQAAGGCVVPPLNQGTDVQADLIDTLNPLIAEYGADKFKRLVDLLG